MQIYDEDPEKAKEERDRKNAKLLEREDAASAADPTKPKSKAQRDRERAETKKAKEKVQALRQVEKDMGAEEAAATHRVPCAPTVDGVIKAALSASA